MDTPTINSPSFQSETARRFVRDYGPSPTALCPYGETLLHVLAGGRLRAAEYRDLMAALRGGWSIGERGTSGCSVLDAAVDSVRPRQLALLLHAPLERGDLRYRDIRRLLGLFS